MLILRRLSSCCFVQTEEAKHEANKNTGSGESLGDKASHVGNVASNKVLTLFLLGLRMYLAQCAGQL